MEESKRKLLLVDDSSDLRRMLMAAFADYEILEAENGQVALEVAAAELPDVYLLDVGMPVVDGVEACRRIRSNERLRHGVVIMLTGRSEEEDERRGMAAGADAYVTKPFSPSQLKRLVQEKIAHKLDAPRSAHAETLKGTVWQGVLAIFLLPMLLSVLISQVTSVELVRALPLIFVPLILIAAMRKMFH